MASWEAAGRQLSDPIDENRPFYPDEVWKELNEFHTLAMLMATNYAQSHTTPELRSEAARKSKLQLERVERAIRERLAKFNGAN